MLIVLAWALVGILLGIVWLIVLPWTAARLAGHEWIERVSDRYLWLAQTCGRRTAIIVRDGDLKLIAKRYDSELKADKDTASGDERHHRDDFDVVGRLKGKILAFALADRDSYISPLLAELGAHAKEAKDEKEIGAANDVFETDAGRRRIETVRDGIPVPTTSQLVDLSDAKWLTTGSAKPEDAKEAFDKTKISQEKFRQRVSFGQAIMIAGAFLASFAVAWLGASQAGGSAPSLNETTVSLLPLLGVLGWGDDDGPDIPVDTLTAAAWLAVGVLLIPLLAGLVQGALIGILVFVLAAVIGAGVPALLVLFGPSMPVKLGLPLARGWWILAQLTVGRGVIVERDSGKREHHQLRDGDEIDVDERYWARLDNGEQLAIDGEPGDLVQFAWAPLGFAAGKTEQNMSKLSENPPEQTVPDGGQERVLTANERVGRRPYVRVPGANEWNVTLPQLWQFSRGSSESQGIRRARKKAMAEHGGEQRMSTTVFVVLLVVVLTLGAGFGLVAGGAIP